MRQRVETNRFWDKLKTCLGFVPALLLAGAAGCSRSAQVEPGLDPVSVQAPETPRTVFTPFSDKVYTGAELIGEARGRPPMEQESGAAHGAHHQGMEMNSIQQPRKHGGAQ